MTTTAAATKYLSTADKCRAALKAAGYKTTQVTVKADGSSCDVTIRSADVSITAIEAIANPFEKVRYCEASGEILGGGNTFVSVSYSDTVLAPLTAEITAILVATKERSSVQVGPYTVFWAAQWGASTTPDHNAVIHTTSRMVTGSRMPLLAYGLTNGAQALAVDLLARGIKTLVAAVQS